MLLRSSNGSESSELLEVIGGIFLGIAWVDIQLNNYTLAA